MTPSFDEAREEALSHAGIVVREFFSGGDHMSGRAYDLIRSIVERHGGTMVFEREGHRFGAWVVTLGETTAVFEGTGERSFPEFDRLFVARVSQPRTWDDRLNRLIPEAEASFLAQFGNSASGAAGALSASEIDDLRRLIDRTKWKFAWAQARTYPHEYTTKTTCSPEDHGNLIDVIEKYGVVERFGDSSRKYLHFDERKYWHMGDPRSEDPEERPNVINRCWVDVRRHAENVVKGHPPSRG